MQQLFLPPYRPDGALWPSSSSSPSSNFAPQHRPDQPQTVQLHREQYLHALQEKPNPVQLHSAQPEPVEVTQVVLGVLAEFGGSDDRLVEAVSTVARRVYRMVSMQAQGRIQQLESKLSETERELQGYRQTKGLASSQHVVPRDTQQPQQPQQPQQQQQQQQEQPSGIRAGQNDESGQWDANRLLQGNAETNKPLQQVPHLDTRQASQAFESSGANSQDRSSGGLGDPGRDERPAFLGRSAGLALHPNLPPDVADSKRAEILASFMQSPKLSTTTPPMPASPGASESFSLSSAPHGLVQRLHAASPSSSIVARALGGLPNKRPRSSGGKQGAGTASAAAAEPSLRTYLSEDSTASNASPRSPLSGQNPPDDTGFVVAHAGGHGSVSFFAQPKVAAQVAAAPPLASPLVAGSKTVERSLSTPNLPRSTSVASEPFTLKRRSSAVSETSTTPSLSAAEAALRGNTVRWTQEQDEALSKAVKDHGEKNWKAIAELVPGRDHVQCLQRWKKVLRPGLVKGSWSTEEDERLTQLVQADAANPKWGQIAAQIDGRTPKQCRERWSLNLDPSINRAPWTPDEDALLLTLQEQMGSRWAEIKWQFKGRTENNVKTRFKSLMRARAREWTAELDNKLLLLAAKYGKDWATIAAEMPKRTKNAIKTRLKQLQSQGYPVAISPGRQPSLRGPGQSPDSNHSPRAKPSVKQSPRMPAYAAESPAAQPNARPGFEPAASSAQDASLGHHSPPQHLPCAPSSSPPPAHGYSKAGGVGTSSGATDQAETGAP